MRAVFSSEPTEGGKHQYSLTILEALMTAENTDIEFVSLNAVWDKIFQENNLQFKALRVNRFISKFSYTVLKFRLVRLQVLRLLLRLTKTSRVIHSTRTTEPTFVVSGDSFGYLYCRNTIFPIFDLMDSFETFSELGNTGFFSWRKVHYKNMVKFGSKLLVDSDIGKRHISLVFGDKIKDKVFVLPYVAANYIRNVKRSPPNEDNSNLPIRFFYPAQFWSHKNHIIILEAARLLINDGIVNWRIDFIGSEKNSVENVNEYIDKHELSNYVFTRGYVSDSELAEFYIEYDCLLFASRLGPTNIPPIEAEYVGLPMILSDCYSMSSYSKGVLHFSPYSSTHLAVIMKKYLQDKNLRYNLAMEAMKVRGGYSLQKFSNLFWNICTY